MTNASVGALVLAAGQSTRMGRTKQTLPWGTTTVIGAVVRSLQRCPLAQIVVVTGAAQAAVEQAVAAARQPEGVPVSFAHNPDYAVSEMARSMQAGLRALPTHCEAALVALADQPWLDPATVERLIERWQATRAAVVAPFFEGQRGHPMLFGRAAWPAILALPLEANPRQALAELPPPERVEVREARILDDMDTPEAYARAVAKA